MIQDKEKVRVKQRSLQNTNQSKIVGKTHRSIFEKNVFKYKLSVTIPLKRRLKNDEFLHSDMINKPYSGFIGKEYFLFTNTTTYYVKTKIYFPLKQINKEGLTYNQLNEKKYNQLSTIQFLTIQYINKYTVSLKITI